MSKLILQEINETRLYRVTKLVRLDENEDYVQLKNKSMSFVLEESVVDIFETGELQSKDIAEVNPEHWLFDQVDIETL